MNEEKICKNCKNFLRHYVRVNGLYHFADCGECVCARREAAVRHPADTGCKDWQRSESGDEGEEVALELVLRTMAHTVEAIAERIEDDRRSTKV